MIASASSTRPSVRRDSSFSLRFDSLFDPGRALAFPCDEQGQVELNDLSERARLNYFYARAVVGREFATPAVVNGCW
jgi:hypothetical protein